MIKQYIGDKKFYRTVLAIAIPIMLQNGITNFVSLLDNIMIGRVGTLEMTGVALRISSYSYSTCAFSERFPAREFSEHSFTVKTMLTACATRCDSNSSYVLCWYASAQLCCTSSEKTL